MQELNGLTMSELYNKIVAISVAKGFVTSGLSVDWTIKVDSDKKLVVLLFEESNGKADWRTNFNFPTSLYKQQKNKFLVHGGYGKAYKSCNNEIMHVLNDAKVLNPDFTVLIAGWSYGGAMAVLAGEDYEYRTGQKPIVITYGAPKVLFGRHTKQYFDSCFYKVKQFAHVNDCVPLVPPFIGFTHVNKCKVGTGFSLIKLFKPTIYHCIYGDSSLYN